MPVAYKRTDNLQCPHKHTDVTPSQSNNGACPYEPSNPTPVTTIRILERPKRLLPSTTLPHFILASISQCLLPMSLLTTYRCPYEHTDATHSHHTHSLRTELNQHWWTFDLLGTLLKILFPSPKCFLSTDFHPSCILKPVTFCKFAEHLPFAQMSASCPGQLLYTKASRIEADLSPSPRRSSTH
jgi:hypothetical protein